MQIGQKKKSCIRAFASTIHHTYVYYIPHFKFRFDLVGAVTAVTKRQHTDRHMNTYTHTYIVVRKIADCCLSQKIGQFGLPLHISHRKRWVAWNFAMCIQRRAHIHTYSINKMCKMNCTLIFVNQFLLIHVIYCGVTIDFRSFSASKCKKKYVVIHANYIDID